MIIVLLAAGGYHLQAIGVLNLQGKQIDSKQPKKVGQDAFASCNLPSILKISTDT